jgi:hypothetical protein
MADYLAKHLINLSSSRFRAYRATEFHFHHRKGSLYVGTFVIVSHEVNTIEIVVVPKRVHSSSGF